MLILQITVAAFTALGIYFSVKVIMGMLFPDEYLTRSVVIDKREKLLILDMIIDDARSYELRRYKNNIVIAIDDVVFSSCSKEEKEVLYSTADKRNAKIIIF